MTKILPFLIFICSNAMAFDVVEGPASAIYKDTFVNVAGDTMTGGLAITANAFSVGGSTLVVSNGNVGIGDTPLLTPASGKLQVLSSQTSGPIAKVKQTAIGDGYRSVISIQNGNGDDLELIRTDRTQTSAYYTGGKTGSSANIGVSASVPIQFATANTMRMFISAKGLVHTYLQTLAQIDALAPEYAGGQVTCSNCAAPYTVCMSTGTGTGAFVKLNTADHCQ